MVDEIIVRQSEIPAHSPLAPPRVSHNEATLRVFVTHGQNGMAAVALLAPNRHGSATRVRDFFRVEAFVNREPENEWIAGGETSLQLW